MFLINGIPYTVEKVGGVFRVLETIETGPRREKVHITGPTLNNSSFQDSIYFIEYCCEPELKNEKKYCSKCDGYPSVQPINKELVVDERDKGVFTHEMFNTYYRPLILKLNGGVAVGCSSGKGVDDWSLKLMNEMGIPYEVFDSKNYGKVSKYGKCDLGMVLYAPGNIIAYVNKQNPFAKGSATFWNIMSHIIVVDKSMEKRFTIFDVSTLRKRVRLSNNTFEDLPLSIKSVARDVYNIVAV